MFIILPIWGKNKFHKINFRHGWFVVWLTVQLQILLLTEINIPMFVTVFITSTSRKTLQFNYHVSVKITTLYVVSYQNKIIHCIVIENTNSIKPHMFCLNICVKRITLFSKIFSVITLDFMKKKHAHLLIKFGLHRPNTQWYSEKLTDENHKELDK